MKGPMSGQYEPGAIDMVMMPCSELIVLDGNTFESYYRHRLGKVDMVGSIFKINGRVVRKSTYERRKREAYAKAERA